MLVHFLPITELLAMAPSSFSSSSTAEEVVGDMDLHSYTIIITGANAGIGFETARVMAKRGAQVILACRNLKSAEAAKSSILEQVPSGRVIVLKLDLSSLSSVRQFAKDFISLNLPLNILINNAGIAHSGYKQSEDGIELTFATNYLGHFLLTDLLLDTMITTAKESGIEGRIVNVSSKLHKIVKGIDFEYLNKNNWKYSTIGIRSIYGVLYVYGQSKLAIILHSKALSSRLKEQGANVTINALHPGDIHTNIVSNYIPGASCVYSLMSIFLKSIPQGAATTCYVAIHPNLQGISGRYFVNCNDITPSKYANDPNLAEKIWKLSKHLVAIKKI